MRLRQSRADQQARHPFRGLQQVLGDTDVDYQHARANPAWAVIGGSVLPWSVASPAPSSRFQSFSVSGATRVCQGGVRNLLRLALSSLKPPRPDPRGRVTGSMPRSRNGVPPICTRPSRTGETRHPARRRVMYRSCEKVALSLHEHSGLIATEDRGGAVIAAAGMVVERERRSRGPWRPRGRPARSRNEPGACASGSTTLLGPEGPSHDRIPEASVT